MLNEILNAEWGGNKVSRYLVSLGILLVGALLLRIAERLIAGRLKKITQKETRIFDWEFVKRIKNALFFMSIYGIFYLSIQGLKLNPSIGKGFRVLGVVLFIIVGVQVLMTCIKTGLESYWVHKTKDPAKKEGLKGVVTIARILVWIVAGLLLLDNLGFKISALVAGLGVGGIAIALAAQTILGDLFSYFSIMFDRPFEAGDFIIIGEHMGAIEYTGIKTTRIRSLSGEQLLVSNKDLTNTRIRNYKRMERRRVVFKIGVTYQTPAEKLKMVPDIIRSAIEEQEDTVFDRSHFSVYGDFSLVFESVYYVIGNDYLKYMNIQHAINLRLYEEFENRGIEFAYPTQTVYLAKEMQSASGGEQP